MQSYDDFLVAPVDGALLVLDSASIEVRLASTGQLATLWKDDGITSLSNPFTGGTGQALEPGRIRFYARDGKYIMTASHASLVAAISKTVVLDDPAPKKRVIASRGMINTGTSTTNKQVFGRSKHVALDDIDALALVYTAWYGPSGGQEIALGGDTTYKASIEFNGVLTQITFGGASVGTCLNGSRIESDMVQLPTTIKKGQSFYVRSFQSSAFGIVYQNTGGYCGVTQGASHESGEFETHGVTTTDRTGDLTTTTNQSNAVSFRPVAIIGYSSGVSMGLLCDSKGGTVDSNAPKMCDGFGLKGELEPIIGRLFATLNCGISGDTLTSIAGQANIARRLALLQSYCDVIVTQVGINDATINNRTSAQMITDLYTVAGLFAPLPFYACTITPRSTSTDGWGTATNQTTDAKNSERIAYNLSLRQGLKPPVTGMIELADLVESRRDSGKWKDAEKTSATFSITTGTAVLTDSASGFVPSDVGKYVSVVGAGAAGAVLTTYIIAYTNAGSVTLAANAGTTVGPTATGFVGLYTTDGIHPTPTAWEKIGQSAAGLGVGIMLQK